MKAVQLTHFGAPGALTLTDLAAPTPGPGQVEVSMEASGINFAETRMREDRYAFTPPLPCVLGSEVVGVVAAVGPGVTGLAVGDRAAAALFATAVFFGGYAEQVVVDADFAVPLPAGLPAEQACALMVQRLTALALTRHAPVLLGRSVLVAAAAGGVGALLVQLLRRAGARQVIGPASTAAKRQHMLTLGADAAINYTLAGWPQQLATLTDGAGPDVVFDSVGGTITAQRLASLAGNGTMVVFGALNIQSFSMGVSELVPMIFKNRALKGFALVPLLTTARLREDLQTLAELALQAELLVDIGGRYPLSEAAQAHRDLAERQVIGKLVLLPWGRHSAGATTAMATAAAARIRPARPAAAHFFIGSLSIASLPMASLPMVSCFILSLAMPSFFMVSWAWAATAISSAPVHIRAARILFMGICCRGGGRGSPSVGSAWRQVLTH